MPHDNLTIKQENFCLKYIQCGNASEAYRYAYNTEKAKDKTVWENASRLLADSKVSSRIDELRQEQARKHEVTIESITEGLMEVVELSRKAEDRTNLRQANMDMAKLHGIVKDKLVLEGEVKMTSGRRSIAERAAKRLLKGKNDD